MTVLYVLHDTNDSGGASKSFLALIDGVRNFGVTPIVVVPNTEGITKTLEQMGVETIVAPVHYSTYPRLRSLTETLLSPLQFIAWRIKNNRAEDIILSKVKGRNIDLVHSNVSVIEAGYNIAQKLNIPHIYHFREYGDRDFALHYFPCKKSFYRKIKKPNSYFITITRDIKDYHGLPEDHSRVIYNGIVHRKETLDIGALGHYFLYAGRIEPAKGLLSLLVAYKEYAEKTEKPYRLDVYGDSVNENYYNNVTSFIADNKLQSLVNIHPSTPHIKEVYSKARAIIVPSVCEGFGRCMPEAMMEGCLVIGHNTGGTKEQFDNGLQRCGEEIGLRYNTEAELAKALSTVQEMDDSTANEIRQRAFNMVNTSYTIEANSLQICKFYNDILPSK